jgi:uncharacterized membrane protein SpoIIM required for sporulation
MKETQFIEQNKAKWQSFESILAKDSIDPEKLKDIFLQVTDDLSFARTFYPNRSVRVYLNGLAKEVFNKTHHHKKTRSNRLLSFWTEELPRTVYESRKAFRLSFFVFIGSMLIGALSSAMDPEFVRTILGDGYVDMTLDNIADGDPMRVYKESKEMGMSVGITLNNLMVAFLTFLLGIVYLIGSIGILISNGVMVGSFQYFFYEQGFLLESFLTIWMHGTLEISAIIIAGAAGITMGRGLAFPGTYSRAKAFQLSAKRGLKIMIGITPIFILAGFIEGFITRHTEIPNELRALFILGCLAFVIGYFVIYPIYKKRKGFEEEEKNYKLQPDNLHQFAFYKIKNSGELFNDSFLFFSRHFGKMAFLFFVFSLLYVLFNGFVMDVVLKEIFVFEDSPFEKLKEIPQLFYNVNEKWLYPFNVVVYTLISLVICFLFEKRAQKITKEEVANNNALNITGKVIGILIISALSVALLAFNNFIAVLAIPVVFPFLCLWIFATYKINIFQAISKAFTMYFGNFSTILGLSFSFFIIFTFFYSFNQVALFWLVVDMLAWNLSLNQASLDVLVNMLLILFAHFNVILGFTLYAIGGAFSYYSFAEELEAVNLLDKIDDISFDNQIRGIAKEV